jgi:ABC-type polysaccharide/polyol phosphate export permease
MAAELLPTADYFRRVYQMRYFWWSLVVNDLKSRYRHSFLGIAWSLGRPIFMTVVLSVIFSAALRESSAYEYAPFVFLSIALWQFVTETVLSGCSAFRLGGPYIRQQPLPLVIFPLRTVLGTSIHAGLALLVALGLIASLQGLPEQPAMLLAAVPGIVLLFVTAVSLATVCGILHTQFPDTQHLVDIVLQGLFYITPIMYRATSLAGRPRVTMFINWNPFTALLELVRQPLLHGKLPAEFHLWYAGLFALALCGLAWVSLRRVEKSLVYWVV